MKLPRTIIFLSLSVLLCGCSHKDRDVDSFIRAEMAKQNIPAITVSVIKNGQIVFEKGYGVADSEGGIKATPSTPFYTASVYQGTYRNRTYHLGSPAKDRPG